ncbi:MAG: hypothetical protein ACR2MO_04475 [Acidimicrobiales bacterium]
MVTDVDGPITRRTIESKLREIRGEVDSTAESARPYVMIAGVVVAVAVVGMAYLLGKRKGKRKTTLVEIRRV